MKLKLKLLAATLAMGFAVSANAAFEPSTTVGTGSSLVLMAWDPVTNESYTRDLGVNTNDWLPNSYSQSDGAGNKTPETGFNQAFAADSLFSTLFDADQRDRLVWNVRGGDSLGGGANGIKKHLTTFTGVAGLITNGAMDNASTSMNAVLSQLNANGCGTSCQGPSSGIGYGGDASWGEQLGGQWLAGDSAGLGTDTSLNFIMFERSANLGSATNNAISTIFGNSGGLSIWTLNDDGSLTYSLAAVPTSEVPVPAAVWLLGSGLLGLVGVARRRK